MTRGDLLPLKAVAGEIGVSRTTLWRAMKSNIAGFPQPRVIRRLVFWAKSDLPRLEEAMLKYEGRRVFERQREHQRKLKALLKGQSIRRARRRPLKSRQAELF